MVRTPLGIVLCSDSLVSTSTEQSVIRNPDNMTQMRYSDFHQLYPHFMGTSTHPPLMINPDDVSSEEKVISTSPNVKKIFQVSDLPIGFSFSGDATLRYSQIRKGGGEFVDTPIETYVNSVVNGVVGSRFDKENFTVFRVGECISLAMAAGYLARGRKGNGFHLIGGGFSSDQVFPDGFELNFEDWHVTGDRGAILTGSMHWLVQSLIHTIPMRCSSRDWFDEYLKHDLDDCLEIALCSAWWWALSEGYSSEFIYQNVIPVVTHQISCVLSILGDILTDHPIEFLNQELVSFSDVVAIMWDLRKSEYESKWKHNISESAKRCDIGDRVSELWDFDIDSKSEFDQNMKRINDLEDSLLENLQRRTYSLDVLKNDSTFHSRLPEDCRSVLSEDAYNTLYFLIENYLRPIVLADSLVDNSSPDKAGNYQFNWGGRETSYGITTTGQSETVDRIMWGMDARTAVQVRAEIKRFQMHTAKRTGELLYCKSNNIEPPK